MAYEDGVKDEKVFDFFRKHIIDKRVYVILDWESSLSTIETLMYDHGVIEPKDESEHEFHKGEFDASYRDGTASLSFIIWRGDKIIYSEVYKGVKCYSATEAEAYAAFALLTKAAEMGIEKLQVCSDCMPVCKILSGELCIPRNHKHWNLYLMLRSLRRLFTKLVVTWKPRELMIFPDDLAKANVMAIGSPLFPKELLERWKHHLSGLVLFRIERTEEATKRIAKFGEVDESYAQNEASVFLVEVEEDLKPQCLQYLKKALKPKKLIVTFDTTVGRSEGFKMPPVDVVWSKKWEDLSGRYRTVTDSPRRVDDKQLLVVYDGSIPNEVFYQEGAFHVMFVTAEERKNLSGIPELNALSYVYFNGVRYPLNKPSVNPNTKENDGRKEEQEGSKIVKKVSDSEGGSSNSDQGAEIGSDKVGDEPV